MKCFLLLICIAFTLLTVDGADSLFIRVNATKFIQGDTLEFNAFIPDYAKLKLTSATLHVFIEDLEKNRRWKFRYPILNGEVSASLTVTDKIPDGQYAINFFVQRGFFKVQGEVLDHDKKDTSIVYMMIPKNKSGTYIDNAHVSTDGTFRLKSTLFSDSAFFVFSPNKKVKGNTLSIKIETPLDSTFIPIVQQTVFVRIGDSKKQLLIKTDTISYQFQFENLATSNILPSVTVYAKTKTKVQQYDEAYSRGLFKKDDEMIFDGIESQQIAQSMGVLLFLQGKVPGLSIEKNESGLDVAKWRNEVAEIYIDEFRLDAADASLVTPSEVAMIKVYRPPAQLSAMSGGAGAIAIYTKKGAFADNLVNRHIFILNGYTKLDSSW